MAIAFVLMFLLGFVSAFILSIAYRKAERGWTWKETIDYLMSDSE